ncbi:hypothetical protein NDU88_002488 [Pleurodeles waltl]|uniref:Fibronectin type-III domain-containing protein n=1 Tax=Pleurodeles waltl TaxID=8319 RepID=A0AAV7T2J6_PLEWA|nr:hypothetical protein NDU88_002488 [Pleurodeles waltl]
MTLLSLLVAFLDLIVSAVACTATYQIPPCDFLLTCALVNATSHSHLDVRVPSRHSSWKEGRGVPLDEHNPSPSSTHIPTLMVSGKDFLCCYGNNTAINVSALADGTEMKNDPAGTHASIYRQNDLHWRILCWTTGNMDKLVCQLNSTYETYARSGNYGIKLFYMLSNLSIEESFGTQEGSFKSDLCQCSGYTLCQCSLPIMNISSHYTMWVDITTDMAHFESPLLDVKPLDIVKPNPPLNLKMKITEEGKLQLCWSHPKPLPYELQYEVKQSGNVPGNTWQVVETVRRNCITLGTKRQGSSHFVQVRGRRIRGPGLWSDWSSPLDLASQEVMYFPQKILTSVGSSASFYCTYNKMNASSRTLTWWLNLAEKVPEQQYTFINENIGKVTLLNLNATKTKGKFPFDALYCCHNDECHHSYAQIYVIDVNISISCETDSKITKMTCTWAKDKLLMLEESYIKLKYYRSSIYCSEQPSIQNTSDSEDCWLRSDDVYECIFQPIYPVCAYTMWIDITHPFGSLASAPICVMPRDVVKPSPPSNISAEIATEGRLLNVSWKRPNLPVEDLRFQVQYSADGKEGTWKIYDMMETESTYINVSDVCAAYIVQVRCSMLSGAGYWSEWSNPIYSTVKDVQVPLKGPSFWRKIEDDPINKRTMVTLLWEPLKKNYSLCSVSGYAVEHHTSNNAKWSEYIGNKTQYTFSWSDPVHTVTVQAINSIGSSIRNLNLTFSQQMSTVNIVHSLRVYLINNSCAALFWTTVPGANNPRGYVIEWENLSQEKRMQWISVPPDIRRYYIHDHFIAVEKYRFTLYPVLAEGICKPKSADRFSTDEIQTQNDTGMYVILPIIVLSSFLLVAALLISHHRMKKMFWEDVPNPQNCSWAQGVNFQKPETLEHLFIKHHETLAFEPPLFLEHEISVGNVSVKKDVKGESKIDLLAPESLCEKVEDPDHDSACASIDKSYQESTSESIKYAVIVSNSQSSGLRGHRMSVSGDSLNGGHFGENSPGQKSSQRHFWDVDTQALLILAGLNPIQPGKSSPCSTASSEGFSEPSDADENFLDSASPERECYYVGISSTEHDKKDFPEDSRIMCPFQSQSSYSEITFLQYNSSALHSVTGDNADNGTSSGKILSSYRPQFQTNDIKSLEIAGRETFNIEL